MAVYAVPSTNPFLSVLPDTEFSGSPTQPLPDGSQSVPASPIISVRRLESQEVAPWLLLPKSTLLVTESETDPVEKAQNDFYAIQSCPTVERLDVAPVTTEAEIAALIAKCQSPLKV
jgi:hypothetical protein